MPTLLLPDKMDLNRIIQYFPYCQGLGLTFKTPLHKMAGMTVPVFVNELYNLYNITWLDKMLENSFLIIGLILTAKPNTDRLCFLFLSISVELKKVDGEVKDLYRYIFIDP